MKKHFKQMTNQEIYIIQRRIGLLKRFALNKYQISNHANYRMHQRHIKKSEVYRVFRDYEIVEYRIVNDDLRVVIRSNYKTSKNNNAVVSLSLISGKLITCYEANKNRLKNVNLSKYNQDLEITELFQRYIYKIA